jgi:hypothetical protein
VKRWRDAPMALRWTGAAMQEAAKGFRRLKAYKQLPVLRLALAALGEQNVIHTTLAPNAVAAQSATGQWPSGKFQQRAGRSQLTRRRLKRGVFRSLVELQAAINRFIAETNRDPKPFIWTTDPDEIIATVKRGHQVLYSIHSHVRQFKLQAQKFLACWPGHSA